MIFDKEATRKKLRWWSDLSIRGSSVWCLLLLQVVDEVAAGAVGTEPGAVVGLAQIRLVLEKGIRHTESDLHKIFVWLV